MFCIHCGKEIPDDAKFCKFCGQSCNHSSVESPEIPKAPEVPENESDTVFVNVKRSNIPCPRCNARNCQPITKTSAQSQSGGYSCCAGLCGGILLGPLGLLLGLCGQKASTSVTSQTKWVCMNCGQEFISLNDAQELWKKLADAQISFFCWSLPFCLLLSVGAILFGEFMFVFLLLYLSLFLGILLTGYTACKKGYDGYSLDNLFTEAEWSEWKRAAYSRIKRFASAAIIVLVFLIVMVVVSLL